MQQTGHETRPYVLEGKGGAVEEFKGIDVVRHLDGRDVEGKGVADDAAETLGIDILSKEAVCHTIGNLLKGKVLNPVEELLGQGLDAFWHVESPVLGQPLDDGLLKCGKRCLAVCAVVSHCVL